ncbi:MAG: hypothetical protein V4724_40485 [Pseudomonadota bacterium]
MKKIIGYITIINFFSFVTGIFYFGGDALNGKKENGKFFLANHGKFIEVTERIFNYSACHALLVFFSICLFLIIHYMGKSD